MKLNQIVNFLLISCSLLFFSCKSIPNGDTEFMYVMIYDYENNVIKEVELFINNKKIGESDINGRFMIPVKGKDSKSVLTLSKINYETINDEIQLVEGYVLYYKMGDSNYYFEKAESLLDEDKLESALISIDKALLINEKDEYYFLKSIILYRLGKIDEVKDCLDKINAETMYIEKMKEIYENK